MLLNWGIHLNLGNFVYLYSCLPQDEKWKKKYGKEYIGHDAFRLQRAEEATGVEGSHALQVQATVVGENEVTGVSQEEKIPKGNENDELGQLVSRQLLSPQLLPRSTVP